MQPLQCEQSPHERLTSHCVEISTHRQAASNVAMRERVRHALPMERLIMV